MKLVSALLVIFACTAYGFPEGCSNAELENCFEGLRGAYAENEGEQTNCVQLQESMNCVLDKADRCLSEETRRESQEFLDSLKGNVRKVCPVQMENKNEDNDFDDSERSDLVRAIRECVRDQRKFKAHIDQCEERATAELLSDYLALSKDSTEADCHFFLSMYRCTSKMLGEDCGESLEEPIFSIMMMEMKRFNPHVAEVPDCGSAISAAEDYMNNLDKRKRRSIRDVSFAKLMI